MVAPRPEEGGNRRSGESPIQAGGVLELLLRGYTISDIVEQTGVPALPIVEAFDSDEDFARLGRVRRTLGEVRATHLERLKLDALSRLFQIGQRLKEEYPQGMTGDDVRLIEAERRACVSLIRLSAFPRAAESSADERSPRLPETRQSGAATGQGDNAPNRRGGDADNASAMRELEELAEIWAKVPLSPPRRARSDGRPPPRGKTSVSSVDPGAGEGEGDGVLDRQEPRRAAVPIPAEARQEAAASSIESNDSKPIVNIERPRVEEEGERGVALTRPPAPAALSQAETDNGIAAPAAIGDGMVGLNRAARRRLMRNRRKFAASFDRDSMNDDHPP